MLLKVVYLIFYSSVSNALAEVLFFFSEYMEEMRSDVEILACGSIKNLTAFKIPDTDENWCCLVSFSKKRGNPCSSPSTSSHPKLNAV